MTAHLILALLSALIVSAPASQARDAAAAASGTSTIAGQVVTDETAARPVRRAIVTISGDLPSNRSAVTDEDGRFAFNNLPAGRFTVSARKVAFIDANYGATRPGRPGTPLSLSAGQQATITIRMARGAVVAGLVADRDGRPVPGAQVTAERARASAASNPTVGTVTTDDRGRYRIFGLLPGEYVIAAKPTVSGMGAVGARSPADMDALLANLARRPASSNASGQSATSSPAPEARVPSSVAFPAIYFPGTPLLAEAQPVTVAAGEERDGIDVHLIPVAAANLEGTVSGVQNIDAVQISIIRAGQTGVSSFDFNPALTARPTAADSRFKYANVTPGRYTIMARADRNAAPGASTGGRVGIAGGGSGAGPTSSSGGANDFVYAVAEVDVRGEDIAGISLALQPGSVMSGRVVFDETPEAIDVTKARISVGSAAPGSFMMQSGNTIIGNSFSSVPPASMGADGTFTIANIPPGTFLLRGSLPADAPTGWWPRSAILDGRDLLDGQLEFRPGVNVSGVVLTFSHKHSEIAGALRTAAGRAASDYFIVAFPSDASLWGKAPRRVVNVRPASDGTFTIRDLPAGNYQIAALDDLDPADLADPHFLEQVMPASIRLALADGEQKKQDLVIAR